ncbi:MAG: tripartite tricarboxylate transporter substrate binding protein [Acetobacteraceae bacterium]|nr:tripartite tricarboxylate transporter substrate binding protein [Acetobacteraceae bacterium]
MRRTLVALAMGFALVAGPAAAQSFPDRPIRVLMPLAAGSAVDVMTRVIADRMGELLGQRLVIENQPGGAGLIGARAGARATPDGYTILAVNDSILTMLPNMNPQAGYDPLRDFAPITQMARIRWALIANPAFPATDVAGLIAAARARPGQIDFSSGGPGSPHHVSMEMFLQMAGIRLNHVPYRGATPALTAVVSGEVQVGFTGFPTPNQFIQEGRLRLLAVAGTERERLFPDVPTLSEAGVPGFAFYTWGALIAPANVPPAVLARLSGAAVAALNTPAVRERLESLGYDVVANTPEQFRAALAADFERMGALIRSANIRME